MSRKILLSILFFGILALTAFLKPQSSQAACSVNWDLSTSTDGDWSVVYHLTLSDNCPGTNTYDVRVTNRTSNQPVRAGGNQELNFDWGVGNKISDADNRAVNITVTDRRSIDIIVHRKENLFHPDGWYDYVLVRAANSDASDTIQLRYKVENKPDLKIVPEFTFEGGCIGDTSKNITLKITNVGWIPIKAKWNGGTGFWVRVHNGVGDYHDEEITREIKRGDIVPIGDKFEGKINIGRPAGKHVAWAKIDKDNDIREEDSASEKNNKAEFEYTSRNCITPPPVTEPPPPTGVTEPPPPPTIPPGVTITPGPNQNGWIQGTGGDMRIDRHRAGVENVIPSAISKYFSETIGNIKYGIVFLVSTFKISEDGNNRSKANIDQRYVENSPFKEDGNTDELNTSYTNVTNNLRKSGNLSNPRSLSDACGGSVGDCRDLSTTTQGVYATEGNVKITAPVTFINGADHKYYIFLIKGDLTINEDIKYIKGTAPIFIVGRDIIIDPSVKTIEGIYSADRNFIINSNPSSNDEILTINGSIVINAKKKQVIPDIGFLTGKRDLGNDRNKTTAGVQINYRPDLILNAPPIIRSSSSRRIEVAPGQ